MPRRRPWPGFAPGAAPARYASAVQPDPASPAPVGLFNGEAVVLWRLRRDAGWVRCFVAEWPAAFWLGVECAGGELLASETLPTIEAVISHSADLRAALLREGWRED